MILTPNDIIQNIAAWWAEHQPIAALMNTDIETMIENVLTLGIVVCMLVAVIALPFLIIAWVIQFKDWLERRRAEKPGQS